MEEKWEFERKREAGKLLLLFLLEEEEVEWNERERVGIGIGEVESLYGVVNDIERIGEVRRRDFVEEGRSNEGLKEREQGLSRKVGARNVVVDSRVVGMRELEVGGDKGLIVKVVGIEVLEFDVTNL